MSEKGLIQTAVRLRDEDLALADQIAARESKKGGFEVTRAAVLRNAVSEGLKKLNGKKR